MMTHKNRAKAITAIAVAVSVAVPIVTFPLGTAQVVSASSKVRKAYIDVHPEYLEEKKEEVLIEDWALVDGRVNSGGDAGADHEDGSGQGNLTEDGLVDLSNGGLITSTYLDGYAPSDRADSEYDDISPYVVYQDYDSAGLPKELVDPQYFEPADESLYIAANDSILKAEPDMDSETLTRLVTSDEVVRTGKGDKWSRIVTEDGQEGYVLTSTLSYEMVWIDIDRYVWVDTGSLLLRDQPSTESEVVATLYDETRLHCTGISDKWYKVTTDSGVEGYVYISYTTQTAPPTPTPTPVPRRSTGGGSSSSSGGGNSSSGSGRSGGTPIITGANPESIVSICESMLGVPYVYNGESSSGVDCSGLVVYAYRQVGGSLPHFADSIASCGQEVSRSDIQPGDVVCYDYGGGYCGHVAIYVGGGQVIHASNSRGNVRYGDLDMMSIMTIRRMLS